MADEKAKAAEAADDANEQAVAAEAADDAGAVTAKKGKKAAAAPDVPGLISGNYLGEAE